MIRRFGLLFCLLLGASRGEDKLRVDLESSLPDSHYPWEVLRGDGPSCPEIISTTTQLQSREDLRHFLKTNIGPIVACYGAEKNSKKDRRGSSDAALFAFAAGVVGKRVTRIPGSFMIERPSGWSAVGPFSFGKTEQDGDPLSSHLAGNSSFAEEADLWLSFGYLSHLLPKQESQRWKSLLFRYPSELASRGAVDGWKQIKSTAVSSKAKRRICPADQFGESGRLHTSLNVDYANQLQGMAQEMGGLAVLEFVSFAVNEYIVSEACIVVVEGTGLHSVFYAFQSLEGEDSSPFTHAVASDLYRRVGSFSFRVKSAGLLRLYVRLRGVARAQASLSLSVLKDSAEVFSVDKPLVTPDIVGGTFFGPLTEKGYHAAWVPLPLILHSTALVDPHVKISLASLKHNQVWCFGELHCGSILITEGSSNSLPNRQIEHAEFADPEFHAFLRNAYHKTTHFDSGPVTRGHKFIAPLLIGLKQAEESCTTTMKLTLQIKLTNNEFTTETKSQLLDIEFRCRDFDRETFIATGPSFDGSIISFGTRAPISGCGGSCPIVLSQHGTGVSASSQADSFKVGDSKGIYTFGVDSAWLVAPDRHGAHNWETVGRQCALAALFQVSIVSGASLWGSWADKNRIIYSGHSMGGHGALHLAVMSPNRALGCVFNAGWLSKEHYGEANAVFKLDKGTSYTDGSLKALLEAAVMDNIPDQLLAHLSHVPILVRVGADDKTVSPFFSRRLVRLLREAGNENVQYDEVAGKEHWWWDTSQPNDGGCMNDIVVRKFLKTALSSQKLSPKRFDVLALSTLHPTCRGIFCVVEQVQPQMLSSLTVVTQWRTDESVVQLPRSYLVETRNIKRIQLILPIELLEPTRPTVDSRQVFNEVHILGENTQTSSAVWIELAGCLFLYTWGEEINFPLGDERSFEIVRPGTVLCRGPDSAVWTVCKSSSQPTQPGGMRAYSEFGPLSVCNTGGSALDSIAVYLANLHAVAYDTTVRVGCQIEDSHGGIVLSVGNVSLFQSSLGSLYRGVSLERVLKSNLVHDVDVAGGFLDFGSETSRVPTLRLWAGSHRAMEHLLYDIGQPTVPPMMRAPFTNLLPSYFLSDSSQRHKGTGSIFFAGFLGDRNCFSTSGFC